MKRMTILKAMSAAGLLGCGGAAAARPITWDCDTGEGNVSVLETTQAGPAYRISGRVTAVVLRTDPRWVASATIRMESSDRDWLAIRIGRIGDNRLEVRLSRSIEGQIEERAFTTVTPSTPVPFELNLAPGGEATARVGEAQATTRLPGGGPRTVALTCSTGEFLFENVEF